MAGDQAEGPMSPTNRAFPSTLPLQPIERKVDMLLVKGERLAKSASKKKRKKSIRSSTVSKHVTSFPLLHTDLHPWSPRSNEETVKHVSKDRFLNDSKQVSISVEPFHLKNHDLSVTVSLGDGDSYNIRVQTHDGHGFTQNYERDARSAASFTDLFSRAGSPIISPPTSPIKEQSRQNKPTGASRGQSRLSFRDSIASSRKASTRGSTRGSRRMPLSRSGMSTTSSRHSRASNELRAMRLMNKLTRVLRSKQEAKRELLFSQQEFREIFDLRERVNTPLPPIDKPIYNCDIPQWLQPRKHCSHPLFTTFNLKTSKNPIDSTAAELSHQRLDRYLWVNESKRSIEAENAHSEKVVVNNGTYTVRKKQVDIGFSPTKGKFTEASDAVEEIFRKHQYIINDDGNEAMLDNPLHYGNGANYNHSPSDSVDKIYFDENGEEIEEMIDIESDEAGDKEVNNMYDVEPLENTKKTPKHYYYPNYFKDKNDLQSDKRKELAELSFMKHDKILHGMDELKQLLKDVKRRKIKQRKKKVWKSSRSDWLKS